MNRISIALGIGVREDRIERDSKTLVAYLNNVDVA
jgi:hypothetical protein